MKTQIYMTRQNRTRLGEVSQLTGKSMKELIIMIVRKYDHHNTRKPVTGSSIKYQAKKNNDDWTTFHLALGCDDYEVFTDLRNFFKLSVSFIVAQAIEKYLNHIINDKDVMDNCTSFQPVYYTVSSKNRENSRIITVQTTRPLLL